MAEVMSSTMVNPISIGDDAETQQPVHLDDRLRQSGVYVLGKPGTGKSTLLKNMFLQDAMNGAGGALFDPSGDLVRQLLPLIPRERLEDVVILDPCDYEWPFGLNVFDSDAAASPLVMNRIQGHFVDLLQRMWGTDGSQGTSWGPRLEEMLRNLALTLLENPGYTMAEITALLTDRAFRDRLVENVTSDEVKTFWRGFNTLQNDRTRNEEAASTRNKISAFLAQPIARNIVGQVNSTVDFDRFMAERNLVLIPLDVGQLGAPTAQLIGSLMVLQILNAALARTPRPGEKLPRFNLYFDEFQRFASPALATLFEEARKYEVSVTIAHQHRAQLDLRNKAAVLMAGTIAVFSVDGSDAAELAKEFDRTPRSPELRPQPKLTPALEPVVHLIYHGHSHPSVKKIADTILRPIAEGAVQRIEQANQDRREYSGVIQDSLKQGLRLINWYLRDMMEGAIRPKTDAQIDAIYEIVDELRETFRFSPKPQKRYRAGRPYGFYQREPIPAHLAELIRHLVIARVCGPTGSEDIYGHPARDIVAAITIEVDKELMRLRGEGIMYRVMAQAAPDYYDIILKLAFLGEALTEEPILEQTGEYDYSPERRLYSDVESENSNWLANQPRYHFHCKVLSEKEPREYNLITQPLEELTPAASEGFEEIIRERSRREFALPRLVVEDEIHRRLLAPGEKPVDFSGKTTRIVEIEEEKE